MRLHHDTVAPLFCHGATVESAAAAGAVPEKARSETSSRPRAYVPKSSLGPAGMPRVIQMAADSARSWPRTGAQSKEETPTMGQHNEAGHPGRASRGPSRRERGSARGPSRREARSPRRQARQPLAQATKRNSRRSTALYSGRALRVGVCSSASVGRQAIAVPRLFRPLGEHGGMFNRAAARRAGSFRGQDVDEGRHGPRFG